MVKRSPVIGIDLGTTYCCVAYLNSNQIVEIIDNKDGHRVTPSWVAFTDNDEIIGTNAKEKIFKYPENVVFDAKRLIGQKFDKEFQQACKKYNWPFKLTSSDDDTTLIEITRGGNVTKYKPQEISAILLKYMKTIAEERLDTEVKNAVITVPAYFNYHQRTATKEAGELAGLKVFKIINEPTAAALAYVHKNEISGGSKNILVFDLGGGTFDVSIVTVEGKGVNVKATAGNTALGGRDFDNNLSEFIADKIEKQYKKEIKANPYAMRRIIKRSEKLKMNLSSDSTTYFDLSSLADDEDIEFPITRNNFENINSQLFLICMNVVEDCLKHAQLSKTDIDKVVLVGGSTRIPKIQEMLTNFFKGKQLTKAINPDEAVAYGAAVQAAMFNKGDKTEINYEVNDVTPLSLGTDIDGDIMHVIIPRNSKIPISYTNSYYTTWEYRKNIIPIRIYEGESALVQNNTLIGTSTVKLPPKPPGYAYNITFHVNANGILEISTETADGGCSSCIIKYEKLNSHVINDILNNAEINKANDNKKIDVIEKWNDLLEYCLKMEAICDYDKKGITNEDKTKIRNICKEVDNWLEDNKVRRGCSKEEIAIFTKSEEIESVCEPIANSYGYYVKDMYMTKFHKLLTE